MNKNFYLLLQGAAVSNMGNVLYSIAIGIWVYQQTGSTSLMGIMSSVTYIISFALAPFSGVCADRYNRKWILVITDIIRGIAMAGVAVLAFSNHLQVSHILIVAVIAALCNVLFEPSAATLAVTLVEKSKLMRAQSMMQGSASLISLVGNAVSGFIIIFFGVPLIIAVNAVSYIISAFTEVFIKVPGEKAKTNKETSKSIMAEFREGLRYVAATKGLLPLLISIGIMNLFQSGLSAVLYPWASAKGMDITHYGLFMGIEGGIAFAATLLLSLVNINGQKRKRVFFISALIFVTANTALMLSRGFIACTVLNSFAAFFGVTMNMILMTGLYLIIADEHRGKVTGIISSLSRGGVALSMLLYGFFSDIAGVEIVALIGAIGLLIPTFVFLKNPVLNKIIGSDT